MFAETWSATVRGIEGIPVRVEVNIDTGLPQLSVVGLPQGAVREGRDRIQAALRNSGWPIPPRRVTINLAPADLRKEGSGFDLPMALGLLAGMEVFPPDALAELVLLGELGLDGSLRPVRGVLPVALACREIGRKVLVVPEGNAREASAAGPELQVVPARDLRQVVDWLAAGGALDASLAQHFDLDGVEGVDTPPPERRASPPDLAGVVGQPLARRALEIAAAGGHNLLLTGPPGTGKTLLARALPGILPPLSPCEAREATAVHSVAGLLPPGAGLMRTPPFRSPHHGVSAVGLVGGGRPLRPGEVSLAHGGVLFLDELPEFGRAALEGLRQPLEDGAVSVVRARERARFPSRFALVASMNPCPCGRAGASTGAPCTCDPAVVRRYRARVSGPLMDRLDLHVQVDPVETSRLIRGESGEASAQVRARVVNARTRQRTRNESRDGAPLNAAIPASQLPGAIKPEAGALDLLHSAADRFRLSPRGIHRVLRVGRTLADLHGEEGTPPERIAEALQFRQPRGLSAPR
jgi:magnesium chelatase family protein